jgi:CheY-like chemotaxis protein
MFRILVVDDDPVAAYLFQKVMTKNLRRDHELYFVKDGMEALDFLHGRCAYENVPRPSLIFLDLHMPRLPGLETLAAIKNDSDFCVIPVIVLSTSRTPDDVRRSYEAHANSYVQKPTDLGQSAKLVQAVEAFWIDFALMPFADPTPEHPQTADSTDPNSTLGPFGSRIAQDSGEARSRATSIDEMPAIYPSEAVIAL